MKKIFLLFLFLLLLPSVAAAHTHLISSDPKEGEMVLDERQDIVLTFDGPVEKLSTMNLYKDGMEVQGIQVQIKTNQMIGLLAEPLQSGEYTIQWNISGEDGHPIKGEIHFIMQKEENGVESGSNTLVNPPASPNGENIEEPQITINEESSDKAEPESIRSQSAMLYILIVFFILLGMGTLLVRRKR